MKVGVVTFPGSLDDRDAARAVRAVGAEAVSLWHGDADLKGVDAVILPGGFSYGDYLRCGAIARFAPVMDALIPAAQGGLPVLGICNGFQVLCESHLLPGALIRNDHRKFNCVDQRLVVENASTAWTSDFEAGQEITIVLKNGEGGFVADERTLDQLEGEGRVVFRYAGDNPNGSYRAIAGITNDRGNIVGLMPHPEHCVEEGYGPSTDGLPFFTSVLKAGGFAHDRPDRPPRPRHRLARGADPRRRAAVGRARPQGRTSTPASARSSAAAPPAPSSRCTRSCGASTAPTSRRKVHFSLWGENTTDEMREKLLVGIGENAGVVDIGDGWAVTFKVESHNHPSYVEPYQGAATGVGGIIRDIMSMGARPIAVMDPLRFGNLHHPDTQRVLPGVVAGVGGYGNCIGLPNIGGEVVFDDCYQGNPLVNALCVGAMRVEDIHLAKASGVGNKVDPVRRQDRRRRHRRRLGPRVRDLRRGRPDQAPRRAGRRPVRREGAHRVLPRPVCRARRGRHPGPRRCRPVLRHQRARVQRRRRHADRARPGAAARRLPPARGDPHVGEPGAHDGGRRAGAARRVHGDHRPLGRRGDRPRRGDRRRPPRHHLARRGHRRRAAALGRPRGPDLPPPAGAPGLPRRPAGQRDRRRWPSRSTARA